MDKMNDTETADGLVSKSLRIRSGGTSPPTGAITVPSARDSLRRAEYNSEMLLSQSVLHHVELFHVGRTLIRQIDFTSLRELDLFDCDGAANLLQVLTCSFRRYGCCLKGFTLSIDNYPESFDSNLLVTFIDCLHDLEYLTIDFWSLTAPFDLNCISAHASTLARLFISIGPNRGGSGPINPHYVIPLEEIHMLCSRFTELSQLAIQLPKVTLVTTYSEIDAAFQTYLVSELPPHKSPKRSQSNLE